jgi:hypothetical protein
MSADNNAVMINGIINTDEIIKVLTIPLSALRSIGNSPYDVATNKATITDIA